MAVEILTAIGIVGIFVGMYCCYLAGCNIGRALHPNSDDERCQRPPRDA